MKLFSFLMLLCVAYIAGPASARSPTAKQILKGVSRSVVFEVTPGSDGRAEACRLVEVRDKRSDRVDGSFIPSPGYISNACEEVFQARSNWTPLAEPSDSIGSVRETCLWSNTVPDSPICRAELGLEFAEEIPKGIGRTVVLELTAGEDGVLSFCAFAATYNLSGNEELAESPHALYVEDACRKMRSVRWINADRPAGKKFYMPCRYIDEVPVRAFCGRKFGE